jgi:hypothetical protein
MCNCSVTLTVTVRVLFNSSDGFCTIVQRWCFGIVAAKRKLVL